MAFGVGSSNVFEIQGELQARPVRVDLRQAEVDRVEAAQAVVDAIDSEIRALQAQLHGDTPPGEPHLPKTYIIAEIRRLREEELPIVIAALEDARRALQACRDRRPPVVSPPDVVATGRGTPPTPDPGFTEVA